MPRYRNTAACNITEWPSKGKDTSLILALRQFYQMYLFSGAALRFFSRHFLVIQHSTKTPTFQNCALLIFFFKYILKNAATVCVCVWITARKCLAKRDFFLLSHWWINRMTINHSQRMKTPPPITAGLPNTNQPEGAGKKNQPTN